LKSSVINSLKKHEGFSGFSYKDTLGFPTIGFGTKEPLTEFEAEMLLNHRLDICIVELLRREPFTDTLPHDKKMIPLEMAYQMGVDGLLKFKKMFKALKESDYELASKEMLDSKWAIQTPVRAKSLSKLMKVEPINGFDVIN